MPFRVLVCGGREFSDHDRLDRVLSALRPKPTAIIHGGARGADRMAGEWARNNGIVVEVFHADWGLHGIAAGPIRNEKMLVDGKPDLVVSFPGGRGTSDMVSRAIRAGVEVKHA